jgi:hypothetical protein
MLVLLEQVELVVVELVLLTQQLRLAHQILAVVVVVVET